MIFDTSNPYFKLYYIIAQNHTWNIIEEILAMLQKVVLKFHIAPHVFELFPHQKYSSLKYWCL